MKLVGGACSPAPATCLAPRCPAVTATNPRPWEARLPFFYGWVIVWVTFLVGLINSGLTWVAIGVFAPPMAEDTGWSRSALFSGLVVRSYVGAALAPVIGPCFDRPHGARWLSVASGVLMAANVCTLAMVQAEWQFVLLFGGVGGVVSAGQSGQLGALVPKWFVRRRASAMAVATTGIGIAALLVAPPLALLITTFGWRGAWVCVGVATLVLAAVPALLIRRQPEDVGLLPDNGLMTDGRFQPSERSYTASQAFRTRQAWLLLAGLSLVSLYTAGLPTNIPGMLEDMGQSREHAVLGFTLYGAGSVLGRYLWAWPAERRHVRWVLVAITGYGAVVGPLILALPPEVALVYPLLAGLGIGGSASMSQLAWPAYFGRTHLGAITGAARLPITLLGGASWVVLSASHDVLGAYGPGLWLMSGVSVVAMVLFWLARPVSRPP